MKYEAISTKRVLTQGFGLFAIISMMSPLAATAQDAQAAGDDTSRFIETIVVTATKLGQRSLQDTPESVTVLPASTIESAKIDSLRDFVDLTPNLIVRETFRRNESFLTLRGLSTAQGGLPPVSFVIDGVQLGSNDFINQDLLDVERIEILKGPQGALYGQGAIGGAIVVTTKAPTNEFEGFAKVSYGNENSLRVAGGVSGPLAKDRLFARVSGYFRETDGLITNNRGEDISRSEEYNVRGRLRYFAGDALSIDVRGSVTEGEGYCCIQDRVPRNDAGLLLLDVVDEVENPGASSNIFGTDDTSFADASVKIEYDFGAVTLTSITGYASVEQSLFGDADFAEAPAVIQRLTFNTDVFNQELRIGSNGDNRFDWFIGGFYQDRDEEQPLFVGAEITNGGFAPNVIIDLDNQLTSESWALFGQGTFELTEGLEFLVGLRFDRDKQSTIDLNNPEATSARETFEEFQPKVQLSYAWADDILSYVTYSTGFRSGGFTQNTVFDNEVTENYEIGFKGTFAGGLFLVNGAAFRTDYTNQQLSFVVFDGAEARRGVVNIDETTIDGFELEVVAHPTESLDLSVGVGVVDSVVSALTATDPALGDVSGAVGNNSPVVPSFTL